MKQHNASQSKDYFYRRMPDEYERCVLMAAMRHQALWLIINKTACLDRTYTREYNDFLNPIHYNIFRALRMYRKLQADAGVGTEFREPTVDMMKMMLDIMVDEGNRAIYEDDVPEALRVYRELTEDHRTNEEIEMMVSASYKDWICDRKIAAAQEESELIDLRGSELMNALNETREELMLRIGEEEDTLKDFGDVVNEDEITTERMSLSPGMGALNHCLGGGVGKKEHILFAGATGAGKTVFACQLAANLACQGKKVCYVTTEQPANELVPRIVSALSAFSTAKIPFDIVKDGLVRERLTDQQNKQLNRSLEALSGNLGFEEWLGGGLDVSDLEASVRKFKQRYGGIDVLILDWIGGALASGVMDPQAKRQCYIDAARKMKDLAYRYNMGTISMAQAGAEGVNVRHVTERHLAESKTLHREAVAAFGISALRESRDGADNSYSDAQYLYCFKSRKARGMTVNLTRHFDYQYFEMTCARES